MAKRVRRTAEASRELILAVAEARLQAHGLQGLNVADVAREAGMSHGTLLHHFGSSEGMRTALVERMAGSLLDEVLALVEQPEDDREGVAGFFERLFTTLSTGGHARLMAWLAINASERSSDGPDAALLAAGAPQFEALMDALARRMAKRGAQTGEARQVARWVVLLVLSSAIGLGVNRHILAAQLGLGEGDEARFARWLSTVVDKNLG